MDFRNLCQKLDVDTIRAKLPQLPALPAMPQIKFPKSMPKLKSRKIFRSSRENVNRNSPQKQNQQQQEQEQPQSMSVQIQQLPPPIPPSGFIKHTPTRISTISSLMYEDSCEESTYRSANSIDDDYVLPSYHVDTLRPISPIRTSTISIDEKNNVSRSSNTQIRMTFTEKLHRSYKDLSEFRLKNIFAKKTVVRKDSIHVQHYVTHYEEDRLREAQEQERRDNAIAENYTFRFKVSQQNIDHSNSITPDDSPRSEPIISRSVGKSVGTLSGDESGMEATPPPRSKSGIAATRFTKIHSPSLRQSSSEQQSEPEEEKGLHPEPNVSTVWAIQKKRQQHERVESKSNEAQQSERRSKVSNKKGTHRFTSYISQTQEENDVPEATQGNAKILSKLKGFGRQPETADSTVKRKSETSPRFSDEEEQPPLPTLSGDSPTGKAMNALKHNFKRLQQSMKSRSQHTAKTDESGDENTAPKSSSFASKTEKFKTRLRRFRSRDVSSIEDLDAEDETTAEVPALTQSPIRQAITHKFESLKKSFKKRHNEPHQSDDGETSPEKEKQDTSQKRSDTLIKKLRHIRARKSIDSKDEPGANTDEEASKSKSRATKFNEARQRTFKKVNEKMQNMKFFHKSQEQHEPNAADSKQNKYHSEEEDWNESPQSNSHEQVAKLPPAITRRDFPSSHECNSPEQERLEQLAISCSPISIPAARAAWSTKPFLSQSMESDIDPSELPRVLIHQDNSDNFESTLIIAVTRPVICSSPIITEINAEDEGNQPKRQQVQQDWIPNKKIIADFMKASSPKNQYDEVLPPKSGHKRKLSMESSSNSDSDSWMPDSRGSKNVSRRTSKTGLVSIDEKNEAWKVKTSSKYDNQSLYKTKSIDIFEKNILKGGALTAFEDFDDELRNEPVLKIGTTTKNIDSCERESSEDTADDDNSSRITKILLNQSRDEIREESANSDKGSTTVRENDKEAVRQKTLHQYGNSRESLIANFDENDEEDDDDDEDEEEDDDDDDEDDDDDDDQPPSEAPSPPPKMSPPPPPLPQRQPSIRMIKKSTETLPPPPPLPKSKPPPLPPLVANSSNRQTAPPRIPERTASMARAPKPLVKTSSLRVVYSEQVKPADVGKVNKLISKFEPTEGNTIQRPRVIPRRIQQDESEDYSDEEEDYATMADKLKERYANIKIERDSSPTPTNTPNQSTPLRRTPETKSSPPKVFNQDLQIRIKRELIVPMVVTTTDEDNNVKILSQPIQIKSATLPDLSLDTNCNNSCTNSEYGSPLEYPSSLRSSLETIPMLERRDANVGQRLRSVDRNFARSRRSMTRDDENFYSFDSDEENSYYSISSTGSNRYIVDL